MGKTAIIILAAGNSSRLGKPKQLLDVNGKKLLTHVVDQACKSTADEVFVVLGAGKELLTPLLTDFKIHVITHDEWELGMGSSIKKGISEIMEKDEYEFAIISVCDQPYLHAEIFDQLLNQKKDFDIIASAYTDRNYGPPTLFNQSQFDNLLQIKDSQGAKSLIKNFDGTLGLVPFDKGDIDLDTKEDYKAYLDSVK